MRLLAIALVLSPAGAAVAQSGRELYFGGAPLASTIAGVAQTGLTCAGCHGLDGGGGEESGALAPAIAIGSSTLSRPVDDPAQFARAVTTGIGADGMNLSLGMPRFTASDEQIAALRGFLSVIANENSTGVAPDHVTIGVLYSDRRAAADALRLELERTWSAVGDTVFGRAIRFESMSSDDRNAIGRVFLAVEVDGAAERRALSVASGLGAPVIVTGDTPARTIASVSIGASDADVRNALAVRARQDGATALRAGQNLTLSFEAPVIVVLDETDGLRRLADQVAQLRGKTVVASSVAVAADQGAAARLVKEHVVLLVGRPRGSRDDRLGYARALTAVIRRALIVAGRSLTRRAFVEAVRLLRVESPGWPTLDFTRGDRRGTHEVEWVRAK